MRTFLVFFFMTIITLTSCTDQSGTPTVSGEIKGANHKTPPLGHVFAVPLGENPFEARQKVAIADDGSFEIQLPDARYWELMITAVNHNPLRFPIITKNRSRNITVNVKLEAIPYRDDFSNVKIIGDWNNFAFATAEPMQKQDNGSFLFTVESDSDSVGYQLINIAEGARSVNGTMADAYKFDGGGDYISILKTKNGAAEIIFDPDKLMKSSEAPQVAFDTGNLHLMKFVELARQTEMEKERAKKAMQAFLRVNNNPEMFRLQNEAMAENYVTKLFNSDNELLAKYVAINLSEFMYFNILLSQRTVERMVELLPLDDPMWNVKPYTIVALYKSAMGNEEAMEYLEDNLNQIEARKARAFVMLQLALEAKQAGDVERYNSYLSQLKNNYRDIEQVNVYVSQMEGAN